MLIKNQNIVINRVKFLLVYDDGLEKEVEIKENDIVNMTYNSDGVKVVIEGRISKIGINFNSTLSTYQNNTYIVIDGSKTYGSNSVIVSPEKILDINIIETTDSLINPITSVATEGQRIMIIREDELGDLSYSKNGSDWKPVNVSGDRGLSAYDIALKLGFIGTEEEWLRSLHGRDGINGSNGAMGAGGDWNASPGQSGYLENKPDIDDMIKRIVVLEELVEALSVSKTAYKSVKNNLTI